MEIIEEQLKNKDFLEEIKDKADDYMIYDEATEAYHLAKDLEKSLGKIKDFKDKYFDFFVRYKKIIHRLKWIGLPIMAEGMVLDMFKYHFTEIFRIPDFSFEEFWRKLKVVLLAIIIYQDRDKFKKSLREALLDNNKKLTGKKLIINNQEKIPTVGNWLLDYNRSLGTGKVDDLKRIQYFTNNNNIKILDEQEKARVKMLLDLYERLKLSSLTLEGLEEDIPVDNDNMKGTIKGGIFEPVKEAEERKITEAMLRGSRKEKDIQDSKSEREKSGLGELQKMVSQYQEGSLERRAIEEEIKKLEANPPVGEEKPKVDRN